MRFHLPKPRAKRGTTDKLRQLYRDLLKAGLTHTEIYNLSVSKALLKRHGSPEEVDRVYGPGTYWGVKQPYKGENGWRQLWWQVRRAYYNQHRQEHEDALEALAYALQECREVGVTEQEIQKEVTDSRTWRTPWKPPVAA